MIDVTKQYRTRKGKRVIGLTYVPFNSVGGLVTYPIKGSVVVREKPLKTKYCIWSVDGKSDVVWGNRPGLDLVAVEPVETVYNLFESLAYQFDFALKNEAVWQIR